MITKILDTNIGNSAIVIIDHEDTNYLEFYLEGEFIVTDKNEFQEDTRIEISEYHVKMLSNLLESWLKNRSKNEIQLQF